MIQFNLLPDVKLEYVKATRTKRAVITAALIAATTAFGVFLLLFLGVHVVQKGNIKNLNGDIAKHTKELKDTPDLNKILTIQNQLNALPKMHADKAAASRTFGYVQQLLPSNVFLNDFKINFTDNTVTFTGQAATLDLVNTFVDTLKFTRYTSKEEGTDAKAFTGVVMSQFSRTATTATFTINANFDPIIYNNAKSVELTVPKTVTTSSVVNQPANLFKKAPADAIDKGVQ